MLELYAILAVAGGAALGGVLRLLVTRLVVARVGRRFTHVATLSINVTGSFLIGVVMQISHTRAGLDPVWGAFLTTGLIGGYTTFSTFTYETLNLGLRRLAGSAVLYLVGSLILGIGGVYLGIAAARAAGA
jgi:CrcB protein